MTFAAGEKDECAVVKLVALAGAGGGELSVSGLRGASSGKPSGALGAVQCRTTSPSPSLPSPRLPGIMWWRRLLWWTWIFLLVGISRAGPSLPIPLQTRTFFTDWGTGNARSQQPVCVDIPSNMSLCYGVGYQQMRLPNLLEHDTMAEVSQQAGSWVPLINIRCHGDAQLFLCSLFSPVCLDRPIYPCRSLCETVRTGCEGRMLAYGFPWPDMFRCDKFPLDNDMCIASQTRQQQQQQQHQQQQQQERLDHDVERVAGEDVNDECRVCNQVETYENVLDNLCRAEFAVRAKLRGAGSNQEKAGRGRGRGGRGGQGSRGGGQGRRGGSPGGRGGGKAGRVGRSGTDGALRTARILKASGPAQRLIKEALPAPPPATACPACAPPDTAPARGRDSYLVMGHLGPDKKLVINFLMPWTTKSKAIKKAVRTFTSTNCTDPKFVSRTVVVDTFTTVDGAPVGLPNPAIEPAEPEFTTSSTTTSTTTSTVPPTTTTTSTVPPTTTTTTSTTTTTTTEAPRQTRPPRRQNLGSRQGGRQRANNARHRGSGRQPEVRLDRQNELPRTSSSTEPLTLLTEEPTTEPVPTSSTTTTTTTSTTTTTTTTTPPPPTTTFPTTTSTFPTTLPSMELPKPSPRSKHKPRRPKGRRRKPQHSEEGEIPLPRGPRARSG